MAKKYNPQDYGTSFKGSASNPGFGAFRVKAVDTSKQFEQKTRERNRDLQTQSQHLQRSYQVANAQLSANRAKASANFAALKGIASIVGTTASGFNKYMQANEAAQAKLEKEREQELIT